MPIEQATYIDTLQSDWPTGTDPESAGDDHLRLIKQVVKNTFPAINSPVTGTPRQLNDVALGLSYTNPARDTTQTEFRWSIRDADNPGGGAIKLGNVDLPTLPTDAVTLQYIQNIIYRVGSEFVSYTDSRNPNEILGFGTWVAVTGAMYGAGAPVDAAGVAVNLPAGAVAGNWRIQHDAIDPGGYTLEMDAVPPHHHNSIFPVAGDSPNQANKIGNDGGEVAWLGITGEQITDEQGGHTPTGAVSVGTGTGAHIVPGYVRYVWTRTA